MSKVTKPDFECKHQTGTATTDKDAVARSYEHIRDAFRAIAEGIHVQPKDCPACRADIASCFIVAIVDILCNEVPDGQCNLIFKNPVAMVREQARKVWN